MSEFLYGHRNGIHIIDLQKTVILFNEALNIVKEYSSQGLHSNNVSWAFAKEKTKDKNRMFIKKLFIHKSNMKFGNKNH